MRDSVERAQSLEKESCKLSFYMINNYQNWKGFSLIY